jgi:hypothetical protein
LWAAALILIQLQSCRLRELVPSPDRRKGRMTLRVLRVSIVALFITLFPVRTRAQSARDYLNTPVNAASFFVDFINTNTATAAESDLPLPNNEAVGRHGFATILWSFPLLNRYGGLSVTGGYTSVDFAGPLGKISKSGFSDPSITFHANIFGAPALRKNQYAEAIPKSFSSFHLTVNAPLGSYDHNSLLNTGANRWSFNPLVNLSITRDKGVSWFDLYAGARFFTNNNEFQGNNHLSQNPLVAFSGFYSHNIGKRMYVGIGVSYDNGGETYINNIPQRNAANGFRPGFSISRARTIWKYRLTLRYELTGTTPRAAPTNSLLQIRLSGPLF